jgi:hypothetical protein
MVKRNPRRFAERVPLPPFVFKLVHAAAELVRPHSAPTASATTTTATASGHVSVRLASSLGSEELLPGCAQHIADHLVPDGCLSE